MSKNAAPAKTTVETAVAVPAKPPAETALARLPTLEELARVEDADSAPQEEGRGAGYTYVGFYGEKAKSSTRAPLDAAGIPVGEFYLHHVEPIRVTPFGLHLINFSRLYTKQDANMNITSTILSQTKDSFAAGYREHVFAVVAVRLPDPGGKLARGFVPALLALRGGQAQALAPAVALLPTAAKPTEWASRSPSHAASAKAVTPGGRFVLTIYSEQEDVSGTSNTFNLGHGIVRPTPAEDVEKFNNWLASGGVLKEIGRLQAINKDRVGNAKKVLA